MHTQALTEDERRMAEANIGLARAVALRMLPSGQSVGMDWNELYSIACEGLLRGVQKYDPALCKTSGYLYRSCQLAVTNALRARRRSNDSAIVLSLDKQLCADDPSATFGALLPDKVDVEAEVLCRIEFKQMLALCTPREQEALRLYTLGFRQRGIAIEMGISQARVSYLLHSIRLKCATRRKKVAE